MGINTLEATFKWRPNFVTDWMLLNADKDPNNWLHYGRDYASTRFSQLSQIHTGNIRKLVPKWSVSFGVTDAQDSQTTVVNGTLYVTASQNKVFAIDGVTGRVMWKYERSLHGDLGPRLCCDAVNRGVAVYKDKVYLATLDTHLVALNNHNGKDACKVPSYDKETKDIAPVLDGGKEWHPVAYSPKTKLVYVPSIDFSMDVQAKKGVWKSGEWYLNSKVLRLNAGAGSVQAFNTSVRNQGRYARWSGPPA